MPSSKEARARQHRQKERVAAALAERRRAQQRRRRGGAVAGVILLVVVVAIGLAVGGSNNGTKAKVAVAPGKQCVGLKDPLPKGSPAMPLTAGPAPTKLTTRDLKVGTGAVVPKNAKVTVNYVGVACSTGKIFDSSYTSKPFPADLAGGVIAGWTQGVPGMRVGGVRLLSIPSDLGYGAAGSSPAIGPDEPLYFLVAVVKLG